MREGRGEKEKQEKGQGRSERLQFSRAASPYMGECDLEKKGGVVVVFCFACRRVPLTIDVDGGGSGGGSDGGGVSVLFWVLMLLSVMSGGEPGRNNTSRHVGCVLSSLIDRALSYAHTQRHTHTLSHTEHPGLAGAS